ncbi:MAG: helix-turn-helix transcriptional regulator [Kiloniellales bacterium]|nr:helix-turn-helix transcriptional regulator [Kiloniellales bacterium]
MKLHEISASQGHALCGRNLVAFVRCFIARSLADGDPRIARAAEAAKLSVRTLQRRLLAAGLTYHQLLDEVRLETAIHLLVRSDNSVAETARALGYAHPGHFTRAFRRWTGDAPASFRKRLRSGRRRSC